MPRAAPHSGRRHGHPARTPPRLKHCPNCGHDLVALEPVQYGDLFADPRGDTYWKGQLVKLSPTQRIVLHTILTGTPPRSQGRDWQPGQFIDRLIIAERADTNIDNVDVFLSTIRSAFRQVDPDFNHIETKHGEGYRWSAIRVHQPIARFETAFVLYDDGELIWRQKYRIFLSPVETKIMKLLLDARGEPVHWTKVCELLGRTETGSATRAAMNRLRKRFREADPKTPAIPSHRQRGAMVVRPTWTPELNERQKAYAAKRATGWKPVHSRDKVKHDQAR